jgi:16S rRNA (guanine(966)-N(2))-methyltransferase RsmD
MRIISGIFKGRRIQAKSNITARPTTDFAKEGLFNLLNNKIDFEGIRVLDIFAGTGSIGVEFISRGCESVIAIEKEDKHCQFIREICRELKITNHRLIKGDVFKILGTLHQKFDVIFADPPYQLENISLIPQLIFDNQLLEDDGILIVEHGSTVSFTEHPFFNSMRRYGNVHFSFFEKTL